MQQRGILEAWIEATIEAPDWTEPSLDPALTRSYKIIPDYGWRVLRVVHRADGSDIVVVTVFFDRSAKL